MALVGTSKDGGTQVVTHWSFKFDSKANPDHLISADGISLKMDTTRHKYVTGDGKTGSFGMTGTPSDPANLTLVRALTGDQTWLLWYKEVLEGAWAKQGGTLYLNDSQGKALMHIHFTGLLITGWSISTLQAFTTDVQKETMTMLYDDLEVVP